MKIGTEQTLEDILYAIKCIGEVAMERQNVEAYVACEELRCLLTNPSIVSPVSNAEQLKEIRLFAHRIASDLLAAVKFEMHEVLVPFMEVKKPTHEFGIHMFPDYFRWLSPEKHYTPERLVGILEEQTGKLTVALEHLREA